MGVSETSATEAGEGVAREKRVADVGGEAVTVGVDIAVGEDADNIAETVFVVDGRVDKVVGVEWFGVVAMVIMAVVAAVAVG